ncbi:DUF1700 domain-containing protein [Streptomyces sp. CG4]|uniref:DUF1700 domain-containing protein n=1 Tax=Streptomyces sp. CG4 TaxID=408783 RepID=UPI0034E2C94B
MTITEHPLVKHYLATVTRETAGLSPERRNELLADLEEHIAVALEESTSGDDEVRAVLARLGDPRTIAATALGEERPAPQASRMRILAMLVLLAVTGPLTVFTPPLGLLALIGAIWWLWVAPQWRSRDKATATAAALVPPLFAASQWVLPAGAVNLGVGALFIPFTLAVVALPAAVGVHLLRAASRPA